MVLNTVSSPITGAPQPKNAVLKPNALENRYLMTLDIGILTLYLLKFWCSFKPSKRIDGAVGIELHNQDHRMLDPF